MKLEWKEEYSVKVKELDDQHKKLFGFINETDEIIKNNGPKEAVLGMISNLSDYADYHFKTEEKYFDEFGYPESEEHKKNHDSYEEKVGEFAKKLDTVSDSDMAAFSYELLDFLEDWWVGHILHEDMKYSKFFNDHGLY